MKLIFSYPTPCVPQKGTEITILLEEGTDELLAKRVGMLIVDDVQAYQELESLLNSKLQGSHDEFIAGY